MSRLEQRNLAIVVVVAGALVAGTALLANYTGILRADAQEQSQVASCDQEKVCSKTAAGAATFPAVYASADGAAAESCCAAKKAAGTCDKLAAGCEERPGSCCDKLTACCGEKPEACCDKVVACCEEKPAGCCDEPQAGCCEKPVAGCSEKPECGVSCAAEADN